MDTNTLVAGSAVVIALAALIVAIWQGILTRQHNRLSVVPHIRVDAYHSPTPDHDTSYKLVNSGSGPAIIISVQAILDGKLLPEQGTAMYKRICEMLDLVHEEATTWFPYTGDAIAPGEKFELLSLCFGSDFRTKKDSVLKAASRLGFQVRYKSIYGRRFLSQHIPEPIHNAP
jgi:hypothetical protein